MQEEMAMAAVERVCDDDPDFERADLDCPSDGDFAILGTGMNVILNGRTIACIRR